jgi:hypothetical protein
MRNIKLTKLIRNWVSSFVSRVYKTEIYLQSDLSLSGYWLCGTNGMVKFVVEMGSRRPQKYDVYATRELIKIRLKAVYEMLTVL